MVQNGQSGAKKPNLLPVKKTIARRKPSVKNVFKTVILKGHTKKEIWSSKFQPVIALRPLFPEDLINLIKSQSSRKPIKRSRPPDEASWEEVATVSPRAVPASVEAKRKKWREMKRISNSRMSEEQILQRKQKTKEWRKRRAELNKSN